MKKLFGVRQKFETCTGYNSVIYQLPWQRRTSLDLLLTDLVLWKPSMIDQMWTYDGAGGFCKDLCDEDAMLKEKVVHHRDFMFHFCHTVDPILLLPCIAIRDTHKEVVRKKNNSRTDEANMELLDRVKREPNWEVMLLGALRKSNYLETLWKKLYPGEDAPGQSRTASRPAVSQSGSESRFLQDFELCNQLGRGGFGSVIEVKHKTDGQSYAVKIIPLQDGADEKEKEKVTREVRSLARLRHPGIIQYHTSWWECHPPGWDKSLYSGLPEPPEGQGQTTEGAASFSTDQTTTSGEVSDFGAVAHAGKQTPCMPGNVFLPENSLETDGGDPYVPGGTGSSGSWWGGSAEPGPAPQGREESSSGDSEDQQLIPASLGGDGKSRDKAVEGERATACCMGDGRGEGERGRSGADPVPRTYLCLQVELCHGGTLQKWLLQKVRVQDRDVPRLFPQIVEAVAYIHSEKLVHRDLKPPNIFFVGEGRLKIGDFGLVAMAARADLGGEGDQAGAASLTSGVGTYLYRSPEQMAGKKPTVKGDIFSLGVLYVELLVPFPTQTERVRTLEKARKRDFAHAHLKDRLRECDLLRTMLSLNPEERPTAEDLLKSVSGLQCQVSTENAQNGAKQPTL